MTTTRPARVQACVRRLLKIAWLDGFDADHVRYSDSAWRHSATRIALDDVSTPDQTGIRARLDELVALFPAAGEAAAGADTTAAALRNRWRGNNCPVCGAAQDDPHTDDCSARGRYDGR